MVKPTFMCIGVQKAGTCSLKNYLNQSPEIFIKGSEAQFFNKGEDKTFEEIINYENSFDTNKLIVGEKTPDYSYLRFAMDRIYNYNPNIKLILILREPIARAFSQYNMRLNTSNKTLNDVSDEQIILDFEKEENLKLSELINNGTHLIVRGQYDELIDYILSKFPRENLYIGIAEEIKENKQKHYNDIIVFLGAKKLDKINEKCDIHIREYTKPIPKILEKKLYQIYKPHNERLYKILGRKINSWEKYYNELNIE